MSDIFISYKREEQATARKLANALETQGWSVWWDPKLRAGERFNDVIEKALKESKCVVVMWSKRSVESQYVKHEANYAMKRNKLVPLMIEEVELPFRFEDLHTPSLLDWDGSKDISEFRRLVEDIAAIVGPPATTRQKTQRAEREVGHGTISRDKLKGGSTRLPGVEQPKRKLESGTVFRDKLKDGSQGPETGSREAEEHHKVEDGLRELVEALRITRTAFRAQVTRRDQLVNRMQRRLRIRGAIQYDEFFRHSFKKMTVDEKALFDWIRAITEDQLKEGNAKALAVLERHPQLLVRYPRLVDLKQHLMFWLNKYDRVFSRHKDMCLLYVGVGDGVGYPRGLHAEMEEELANASQGTGSA